MEKTKAKKFKLERVLRETCEVWVTEKQAISEGGDWLKAAVQVADADDEWELVDADYTVRPGDT